MKKILIYIDSMAPAGGIERVISNLSNAWIKKYNIVILVKDEGDVFYELNKNIKIKSLNLHLELNMKSRISRIFCFLKSILSSHFKLKKMINNEQPDCIYTSNPLNSLEIFLLGKKYLNKMIISEHGSKFGYNKVYNYIKTVVYPKAYILSVPSTLDTDLYRKEGYPAVYIPHVSTFKARTLNNLDNNIVLNIGRLTSDKQQIKLLEIWFKLMQQNKIGSWKLRIVGKGEEKGNLEKFIMDNKIQDSVEIISPTQNIEEIFKQVSIFAFTSRFEGFGMVLLEAMSFGIPCISFDCPSGPRDIIKNDLNGFLIENNNLDEFGKKLEKLMTFEYLRKKIGKKAFETVEMWNNEIIMRNWDTLFEAVSR